MPPTPMLASRLPDWFHAPVRLLHAAVGALLPSTCALCGGIGSDVVCGACRAAYAAAQVARCPCCANPLPHASGIRCGACLRDPPAYDATVAAVDYAAPLDGLVLQLKFGAQLALAPWCARLIRDAALAAPGLALPDLLCPVPLGEQRLVERGYNQALEIARPLAGALGVALHPRLAVRVRETGAQSGTTPDARALNVHGAFALAEPERVAGRHVGLVDDVMTSGHTLGELAAACKRAGAARVTNFVFARTPPRAID
jgi:ComF family protein